MNQPLPEGYCQITPKVTEFLKCAKRCMVPRLEEMLKDDPTLINAIEGGGYCALHFAAFSGDIKMLNLLISYCPDIDLKNYDRNTPLMLAAKMKRHDTIKVLLLAGADINCTGRGGATAIHHACAMGHVQTIHFLIENGAHLSFEPTEAGSPLHWGCHGESDCANVLGTLLYLHNAPVDCVDAFGGSPLYTAIYMKNKMAVAFLLENGANPNLLLERERATPLHVAVEHSTLDIVKLLLSFGTDPTVHDHSGNTPLDLAIKGSANQAQPATQVEKTTGFVNTTKDVTVCVEKGVVEALQKHNNIDRANESIRFKTQGNKVFSNGESFKAIRFYSLAMTMDPKSHVLFSNRSACYYNIRQFEKAYFDACRCVQLEPHFSRGYYRKAASSRRLGRPMPEVLETIKQGLSVDSKSQELLKLEAELTKV